MDIILMNYYMIFIKEIKIIQLILLSVVLDMKLMMENRIFIIVMIVNNIIVKKIRMPIKKLIINLII